MLPTRVSQRRSRYPLRWLRRRSGARSPRAAPIWVLTSASITSWASTATPSLRKSRSPSPAALRSSSRAAILSSAIGSYLSFDVGCKLQRREDDSMAIARAGRIRCYTNSRDTNNRGSSSGDVHAIVGWPRARR